MATCLLPNLDFLNKKIQALKSEYNSQDKYSKPLLQEIKFLKALKKVHLLKKDFNDFGFQILIDKNQCPQVS